MSESTKAMTIASEWQRHAAQVLERYSKEQQEAVLLLFQTVDLMPDTGGGIVCAKVLLGLYNGDRFPFDLTQLRRLDEMRKKAALTVITMDASQTWCEVHVLLNAIRGFGANTGARFENWAHSLRLKGRCKKEYLPVLHPGA